MCYAGKNFFTIGDEVFRKALHFVLLGAYIPLAFAFEKWWMSAAFSSTLMAILFPALNFAEKSPALASFITERKKGEFKSSMVLAVGMMIFSVAVCWGLFGDRYLVLACVYAWGVGDGLAALVGKKYGKHKIRWKMADGKKSVEGSATMFVCAFVSVVMVLLARGGVSTTVCVITALLGAAVSTIAEMCTKNGLDTVVCPVSAMAVIIPMIMISG